MPFYKVWRDLRSRFFFILVALMALTVVGVVYRFLGAEPFHEAAFETFRRLLFFFWCLGAAIMGLGGFLREKSVGTIDYTLSLPISRTRWFWYRAGMGGFLSLTVAVVSTAIIPITAPVIGGDYPMSIALLQGLRLGLGGLIFYAIGLALSCISGDYGSAGLAAASVFALNSVTRVIKPIRWLNLQDAIFPPSLIDRATYLPHGPLPWNGIGLSILISLVLACIAWRVTLRSEF